jgi:UPF0716 protein FxsA
MLGKIILAIIIVSFVDVYLVVLSAHYFSIWGAIGLCILTAIIGGALFKREGFRILGEFQRELQEGKMPLDKLGDGVLILIGGVFLMTPGFITDFFGFLLLIPFVRKILKPILVKIVKKNVSFHYQSNIKSNKRSANPQEKDAEIIDIK